MADAARKFPKAKKWIESWHSLARRISWKTLHEVRATYPSADEVRVASGRKAVIFNVCGNNYRLIVAIHYNRKIIYLLRFLTHAEYSKDKWRNEL